MKKLLLILLLGAITIGTAVYANDTEGPSEIGGTHNGKISRVED